jgi:hypothetical protein
VEFDSGRFGSNNKKTWYNRPRKPACMFTNECPIFSREKPAPEVKATSAASYEGTDFQQRLVCLGLFTLER